MLRNENGHIHIKTIFEHEFTTEKDFSDYVSSAFTVDIDDCDCISCEEARGHLQKYSTISLSIHTTKGIYSQRLTPEEALELADSLTKFANVLKELNSFCPISLDDMV